MGRGRSEGDLDSIQSLENVGILCVFPVFHGEEWEQKIR